MVGFVSLLVSIFCFLFLYFRLRFEEGIAGGIGIKRVYPLLLLVWNNLQVSWWGLLIKAHI